MSNEDVKVKATAKKPAARTTKAKKPAAKPATRKPAARKTPTKKAPEATVAKPKTAAPKVKKATAPSPTPKSAKPSTQKVKKDDGAKDQSALIHQLQEQVALLTHRVMTLEKDFANLPHNFSRHCQQHSKSWVITLHSDVSIVRLNSLMMLTNCRTMPLFSSKWMERPSLSLVLMTANDTTFIHPKPVSLMTPSSTRLL